MSYQSKNLLLAVSFVLSYHKETPFITRPINIAQLLSDSGIYDEDIWIVALLQKIDQEKLRFESSCDDSNTRSALSRIEEIFGDRVKSMIVELSSDKTVAKPLRKKMQIINAKTMSYGAKCVRLAKVLYKLPSVNDLGYLVWIKALVNNLRGCNLQLEDKIDTILEEKIPKDCDLAQTLKSYFEDLRT